MPSHHLQWNPSLRGLRTKNQCIQTSFIEHLSATQQPRIKSASEQINDDVGPYLNQFIKLQLFKRSHAHIYYVRITVAEVLLRMPLFFHYDLDLGIVRMYRYRLFGRPEIDATGIVAKVEYKTDILLGRIVFFWRSVLLGKELMADPEIEKGYNREVVPLAKERATMLEEDTPSVKWKRADQDVTVLADDVEATTEVQRTDETIAELLISSTLDLKNHETGVDHRHELV